MILQLKYAGKPHSAKLPVIGFKGFTLIELMVVVAIMATVAAVALPSYLTWSKTLKYRDTSLGLAAKCKLARANAVTKNLETRVELDVNGKRYRVTQGNSSSGSNVWTGFTPWVAVHADVGWHTGTACDGTADVNIQFNPNGSSDGGIICIENSTGGEEFRVVVTAISGRVRLD